MTKDLASFLKRRGVTLPVAELERIVALVDEYRQERLSAGREAKRKRGGHAAGRIPYGYRAISGALVADEHTAPIVRRIFQDSSDGYGPAKIAAALNRGGVPSPTSGKPWGRQTVANILRNPVYVGERGTKKRAHVALVPRKLFELAGSRSDRIGR